MSLPPGDGEALPGGPGGEGADGDDNLDMGGLLSHALDLQRQMVEAQEVLGHTEVRGEAGGGLVSVTLTGHFEVRGVHIDPSVVDPAEADLLADLVTAALRNALEEVMQLQAERMGSGMPDLGGLLGDLGDLGGLLGGSGAGPGEIGASGAGLPPEEEDEER